MPQSAGGCFTRETAEGDAKILRPKSGVSERARFREGASQGRKDAVSEQGRSERAQRQFSALSVSAS
eukprot:1662542-Rhodomonas_salina.1